MANIVFSESSGLNDSIYGKIQAPIQMCITKRAEAFEQESQIERIYTKTTSTHFAESYTSLTAMSGFEPINENGAAPTDGMQEGYRKLLENCDWADTFRISKRMMMDAQVVDMKSRPEQFVAGYYRTRERFAAALLGAATTGAVSVTFGGHQFDTTAADKECLFSGAHPSILDSSYTQANVFTNAMSDKDLGLVETAMQNFCGDNGELLGVSPDTIIIPNTEAAKSAVFAAIGSDKDPDTANNGFNYQFARWNVIIWPYLNQFVSAAASPWILMDSDYNKTYRGAVFQERSDLEIDSYEDKATWANVWRGFARFTAGFHDWRAFACGGIPTSVIAGAKTLA